MTSFSNTRGADGQPIEITYPDIQAWSHPGFVRVVPLTDRGWDWADAHINADTVQGAYLAEHRYGPDILLAAHNAGLTVALDGRVADAPREAEASDETCDECGAHLDGNHELGCGKWDTF